MLMTYSLYLNLMKWKPPHKPLAEKQENGNE